MINKPFSTFCKCVVGPQLYQTYPSVFISQFTTPYDPQSIHVYVKNTLETLADRVLLILNIFIGILRIISPLCLLYFYYKGSLTFDNFIAFLRLVIFFVIVPIYFVLLRGVGRFRNPEYIIFINDFSNVKYTTAEKPRQTFLRKYDFSLTHWKPDYRIQSSALCKLPMISTTEENLIHRTDVTLTDRLLHVPLLLLGYICVNVFGRRLMFPGSLQLLRHSLNPALLCGRAKLIVGHQAKRYLLRTADGNHIDTLFVDRRSKHNGQTLVITCEGNAGFYEVGCMMTPIEAGYSVLGWNRPGFGESSGYPGTSSEINSIDAVIQYATQELNFPISNIVIFAWSIGGYSACWAASSYKDIRGLVLDAIFDDVLPLAQRQMPKFATNFVEKTIRYHLNLHNIPLLKLYNGPFYLIRRTMDEIMNFIPGKVSTNRTNEILFSILPYRYPFIYNDDQLLTLMKEYVCSNKVKRKKLLDQYCSDSDDLQQQFVQHRIYYPIQSYPCCFGETFSIHERKLFAIYLVDQYLVDFNSQHCTPLPENLFYLPTRCV